MDKILKAMFENKAIVDIRVVQGNGKDNADNIINGFKGNWITVKKDLFNGNGNSNVVEYLAYRMGNPLNESYINNIKVLVSKKRVSTPYTGYDFVKGSTTNNINYKQTSKVYTYIQVMKTKEFK